MEFVNDTRVIGVDEDIEDCVSVLSFIRLSKTEDIETLKTKWEGKEQFDEVLKETLERYHGKMTYPCILVTYCDFEYPPIGHIIFQSDFKKKKR